MDGLAAAATGYLVALVMLDPLAYLSAVGGPQSNPPAEIRPIPPPSLIEEFSLTLVVSTGSENPPL
jgi:hypothetical protein